MRTGRGGLPTGVVTFLLTDVEESTSLWEKDAAAMSRALEMHDATIAAAVAAAGGRTLKARGEGDSTFSVFGRPTEAVRAAIAARRALESLDWPEGCRLEVRFAIHVGEVEERDDDYFGVAVNRAGRIRGIAVGGQILVSQAVAEVVVDHLPSDVSLVELGAQQLRGLSRPERVCALADGSRPVREAIGGLCPYKGLLAFQPEDEDIFFGREAMVARLIGRLLAHHLVVVVGASGSGKSSLVRAGVFASLRRGEVPGSADWLTLIMTPGEDPATRLSAGLERCTAASMDRFVLVIDQMEELFTACQESIERERFVDILLDAVEMGHGSVLVLAALRADFYGHCATIQRLTPALSDATVLLGSMDDQEVRRAIEAPAEVAGLRLEAGLADVIVHDLGREPGALPLLSHALLETWRRRGGRTLTLAGYGNAGGVRGAIARTAETVWNESLTERERAVARRIFLRLTELGEGTEDTRRRVALRELVSDVDAGETDGVLRVLADRRLVTVDEDTVEVAHEALIREWPRLRGWLDEDREGLRAHRHLTHAAQDWDALGRPPAELYRGPRLAGTREWLRRDAATELNDLEALFVAESEALERQEQAREEEHAAARERANRRLRVLLVATTLALAVALGAGALAVVQRRRADRQAQHARALSVSAEVDRAVAEIPNLLNRDRTLALLLAVEAQRLRPGAATNGALFSAVLAEPRLRFTLTGGHNRYGWIAPLPDGQTVVALGPDGADIWDVATRKKLSTLPVPSGAAGVAVNTAGSLIATGGIDGTVTFWNTRTQRPDGEPLHVGAPITSVAFSHDGRRLAVATGAFASPGPITPTTVPQLWDVPQRRPSGVTLSGHRASVNVLALSPDGTLLAAGEQ